MEVANGLLMAERRGRIDTAGVDEFLIDLDDIPIESEEISPLLVTSPILEKARKHHLTIYDAAYLDLASRLSAPLATLDQQLTTASRKEGVRLWAPSR
jgi:predicted nucleic acid-binding protein